MTHAPRLDSRSCRRGAALLIVLATLAVTVTACATLARIASTATAERRFHARSLVAADLLSSADAPIRRWLDASSASVVLPPTSLVAEATALHDAWTAGDDEIEVRITAYDQCGMLSAESTRSSLRSAIPPGISRAVNDSRLPRSEGAALGLDLFTVAADRANVPVYPTPIATAPRAFGDTQRIDTSHNVTIETSQPAIGAWIATHNAPRLMNVNTTPMPLLEAALFASGRGGLDQIREARSRGTPTPTPPPPRGKNASSIAPTPASSSIAWAFRIDARVGPVLRSQWSVYVRDSERWRCVQRLVIDR